MLFSWAKSKKWTRAGRSARSGSIEPIGLPIHSIAGGSGGTAMSGREGRRDSAGYAQRFP